VQNAESNVKYEEGS